MVTDCMQIRRKTNKAIECDMKEFQRAMNVNLKGVMHGIKHAGRVMIPNQKGCIISTSSIAGIFGGTASYSYTASKHAVIGLTKQGAAEMGKYGIRVNCVSPSGLATVLAFQYFGMNTTNVEEKKVECEEFCNKISKLKNHTLKAHDIAEAALYLASEEAKFVSGHNLVVDGGFTVVNHDRGLY
ncbi:hypothetical protein SUGI_0195200 [Cryptomeria japonica]|nr:hypothetical protein SUGI_0195200 [Cryptomeria japonica]